MIIGIAKLFKLSTYLDADSKKVKEEAYAYTDRLKKKSYYSKETIEGVRGI